MTPGQIARVAHEVNRAYCNAMGDTSQVAWDAAPDWQKESAVAGVKAIASGAIFSPGDSHGSWLAQKYKDGWSWGPVKDVAKKEHPCMVSFDELPKEQQVKDHLFLGVVQALLSMA